MKNPCGQQKVCFIISDEKRMDRTVFRLFQLFVSNTKFLSAVSAIIFITLPVTVGVMHRAVIFFK